MWTTTKRDQRALEEKVTFIFKSYAEAGIHYRALLTELWKEEHVEFLERGLSQLGEFYTVLDSSRPWLCYWIIHSLTLLGHPIESNVQTNVVDFLRRCQDPKGGYGGGPGQIAHLATTYAAVGTLISIGGGYALRSINKENVFQFLLRMKDACGGFRLHEGGEMDVRGCYTALAVAYVLNILTPPLLENVGQYLFSCQTYEGGIGGEPGAEAHGGYTYCGLAAAVIANQVEMLNLPNLLHWTAFRQGKIEGGFQGRTNKLVDGCYSFWQGGIFPLMQQKIELLYSQQTCDYSEKSFCSLSDRVVAVQDTDDEQDTVGTCTANKLFPVAVRSADGCLPLYNSLALQGYLLLCCQAMDGGLIDKPGKSKDFYHTCYGLSGLCTAQYSSIEGNDEDEENDSLLPPAHGVLGVYTNLLQPTHPLINVHLQRCIEACDYFRNFD